MKTHKALITCQWLWGWAVVDQYSHRQTQMRSMLSHTSVIHTHTRKPAARCSLNYPAVIGLWWMASFLTAALWWALIGSVMFSMATFGWVASWFGLTQAQFHIHIDHSSCCVLHICSLCLHGNRYCASDFKNNRSWQFCKLIYTNLYICIDLVYAVGRACVLLTL